MENNILVLGPIIIPLISVPLCLLFSRNNRWQRYIGLLAVFLAWVCGLIVLSQVYAEGVPQIYRLGNWQPPYGIVLVADTLSGLFMVMASTVVMVCVLYVTTCHDKSMTYPAFMPILMCMIAGLHGAFYTGDIFTLFVFIELMVMASVILVAISDNRLGLEAAIKYLLISAMGTLFLLIGIAAVYATFGTLNMADVARLLQSDERPVLAQASAVMLMCAFLLKSAVFPFHFWQPDFHTTAPTPLSALLSSVVVKVGVYGLLRLTTLLFVEEAPQIQNLLVILGIVGVFFGSLCALRTHDAKRILAYSTFGQIGFILIAIGWGTELSLAAAIIYTVNHAFVKSSLLLLIGAVASRTKAKTAALRDLGGVGHGMTGISGLYFLGGLALAGVPPLNGFISKLALIKGGLEAESWTVLGLAVGGGLITLVYMIRTWQLIFQQAPDSKTAPLKSQGEGDSVLAPALLIGLCVVLGLYAVPLVEAANRTVVAIGDPSIYISAVLSGL